MKGTAYHTKEDVLRRAQEIIGIPLKEVDKFGRLSTGKGAIGSVIEESWYGYSPNSESEPDFPEAGVELKVTPYIRRKGEITAKERLVCNIINYMEEYDRTFKTSSFWHKCQRMLLMSYEHLYDKPKGEYRIDKAILFEFPVEDLKIIEHDWEMIMQKVRSGRAHEISEGDTLYLAACTKGATSASVRKQPFSDIPAKQRAYSLKQSYMTQILRRYIFGKEENERIIKDWHVLVNHTFIDVIKERVAPYIGRTRTELLKEFSISGRAKNSNELIFAAMLGIRGHASQAEEFVKADICPKVVKLNMDGSITENISFPAFDFIKISKETSWEDSQLYGMLAPKKFLFVLFQEIEGEEQVFYGIRTWNMPEPDLEEVRRVWQKTVKIIKRGVVLRPTASRTYNNLPKQRESRVAHVRPHGRDSRDVAPLPDGRMMTKQCFWLNRAYVAEQIKGLL